MLQTLIGRYFVLLPALWAAGLPEEGYANWLLGTLIGALFLGVPVTAGLAYIGGKKAAYPIRVVWSAFIVDALAPLGPAFLVLALIAAAVNAMWPQRNTPQARRTNSSPRPSS